MPKIRGANVLIVGATSTIARHAAGELASRGARLHLAARDEAEAERIGQDLAVRRGAEVSWDSFEATDYEGHERLLDRATEAMGGLDGLLVAVGMLGDQARAEDDPAHLREVIEINYSAPASLITAAANRFEKQGRGWIAALSSVAGDRGRPTNYAYGSAKAGLTAFLEGLRGRLHESGVHVLTAKPGPTDTKMTFGMDDPPPLMAEPERVAGQVAQAIEEGKDVCYAPPIWRYIMAAIRLIPASVFKKLDL
ncbi:short-subunit dehydrogenase [Salinibacter ruber]|uniref:SDR family oxidoreductase n=1 Tax=Salinibacter ruber TaxID=146919 RepID=UPI0021675940|nr:SDR family oxidoreductase [Salinibacter ruber]MCS3861640.1 short-subunit dehydrogenase [Salinibacter ruber]